MKKEFDVLEGESAIWKLTGPLLVKQDRADAIANVDKRIEFITSETSKVEELIRLQESAFEEKRMALVSIQEQIQS